VTPNADPPPPGEAGAASSSARASSMPAVYAQMVAECESRRDAAELVWDDAVTVRDAVEAAAADGDGTALRRLTTARDVALAAAHRYEAAVDRLAAARMLRRAYVDGLTGALSRGVGEDQLRHEINRAQRENRSLVVAFVDVDGLKQVNDTAGHLAGDAALRAVGHALRTHLRPYDVVVRFGGDEFLCALPGAGRVEAETRCASVATTLSAGRPPIAITYGLAELAADDALPDLISRADADLYARRRAARVPVPRSIDIRRPQPVD
jgi:diguanylate cyclase (GGDEF)-like protein